MRVRPVAMPWREEVAAIVLGHFGGQEFGAALADVLLGTVEPGGRLTTHLAGHARGRPGDRRAPGRRRHSRYSEGLHIGYRGWLRADAEPAFAFGQGLGYTSWSSATPTAEATADGGATVSVRVTNTGARPGKQVVQVYAEKPGSAIDRPGQGGWSASVRYGSAPARVPTSRSRSRLAPSSTGTAAGSASPDPSRCGWGPRSPTCRSRRRSEPWRSRCRIR